MKDYSYKNWTIKWSDKYDKLHKLLGNRRIDPSGLKKVKASIEKRGFLPWFPIVVNPDGNTNPEGQHRLQAAKDLGVKFAYLLTDDEGMSLEDIRELQDTQRKWVTKDYLESNIDLNNPGYKEIKKLSEDNEVSVSLILHLIQGKNPTSGKGRHSSMDKFKHGKLDFTEETLHHARTIINVLVQLKPHTIDKAWKHRQFVSALVDMSNDEQISFPKLIHKFEKTGKKIGRSFTVDEYLRNFEAVYNHGQSSKNKVRFF